MVAGPNGELDWIFADLNQGGANWTVGQISKAGAHLMGRKTFHDMAAQSAAEFFCNYRYVTPMEFRFVAAQERNWRTAELRATADREVRPTFKKPLDPLILLTRRD